MRVPQMLSSRAQRGTVAHGLKGPSALRPTAMSRLPRQPVLARRAARPCACPRPRRSARARESIRRAPCFSLMRPEARVGFGVAQPEMRPVEFDGRRIPSPARRPRSSGRGPGTPDRARSRAVAALAVVGPEVDAADQLVRPVLQDDRPVALLAARHLALADRDVAVGAVVRIGPRNVRLPGSARSPSARKRRWMTGASSRAAGAGSGARFRAPASAEEWLGGRHVGLVSGCAGTSEGSHPVRKNYLARRPERFGAPRCRSIKRTQYLVVRFLRCFARARSGTSSYGQGRE